MDAWDFAPVWARHLSRLPRASRGPCRDAAPYLGKSGRTWRRPLSFAGGTRPHSLQDSAQLTMVGFKLGSGTIAQGSIEMLRFRRAVIGRGECQRLSR